MKIKLQNLNLDFNCFKPYISEHNFKIHYYNYYKLYIDNLNYLFKNNSYLNNFNIIDLIQNLDKVPYQIRNLLKYNIGGYINHNFFWEELKCNNNIHNSFLTCINKSFGNLNKFKNKFEKYAINSFGSGWLWLLFNNNNMFISFTNNNDNPIMGFSFCKTFGYPVLVLDLWEHAYYSKYKNNIVNYIKSFWKIINWNLISIRYLNIKLNLIKNKKI